MREYPTDSTYPSNKVDPLQVSKYLVVLRYLKDSGHALMDVRGFDAKASKADDGSKWTDSTSGTEYWAVPSSQIWSVTTTMQ